MTSRLQSDPGTADFVPLPVRHDSQMLARVILKSSNHAPVACESDLDRILQHQREQLGGWSAAHDFSRESGRK